MLPFLPSLLNQSQMQGGNDASLPQFASSSSMILNPFGFNNPQNSMPVMGGFNNQNIQLGNSLNAQNLMQGMQNNIAGVLSQQGQLNTNTPILPQFLPQQLGFLGVLSNPSLFNLQQCVFPWRPNSSQNLNQMMGFLPNGLLGSQNRIFAPTSHPLMACSGNHNPGFVGSGNPQFAPPNFSNATATVGFDTQTKSVVSQPILPNAMLSNESNNMKASGWKRPQMASGQAAAKFFSNDSTKNTSVKNFRNKFNGYGNKEPNNSTKNTGVKIFRNKFNDHGNREPSQIRSQKLQSHLSRNANRKVRPFPSVDGRGGHKRNKNKLHFSECKDEVSTKNKRLLAVMYSESEIQQWREARKKNFPTRKNIEKKQKLGSSIMNDEDINSDTKLRRQQLKEVLTKQAELGCEVADIPSSYLTEPETQTLMKANETKGSIMDSRVPNNRTRNKRSWFARDNRHVKKPKIRNETPSSPPIKKREPTLLRKLLNADIRRDKSHLLQAFRFMVLNSFFKDQSEKNLVFPLIRAKDDMGKSEIGEKKERTQGNLDSYCSSIGKNGNAEETAVQEDLSGVVASENECDADSSDSEGDEVVKEPIVENCGRGDKSEEGEITD